MVRFKVIIPTYNAMPWLERCLNSVEKQRYREFDVCIVDDASTMEGQRNWIEASVARNGWKAIYKDENQGALHSTIVGIEALECEPDDVIVTIDGDDWLYDERSLEIVAKAYRAGGVDLTFGQFVTYPEGKVGFARMPEPSVMEDRSYRSSLTFWSHLRTFRAFLWQAIDDRDFRTPSGLYFRSAGDQAYMNPMLEMAGRRFQALDEITYVYNRSNEINDDKVNAITQTANWLYIRNRPKYPVHERCQTG